MKYRSTLFDEARNKIGSAVASKNRNGNYFRNHVIPSNPKTTDQTTARSRFTVQSQAWRSLTEDQRASWISLAPQIKLHDALGNSYAPTGQQLYVSCNVNLALINAAGIDQAPATPDTPPDISNLDVVATVQTAAPHAQVLTVQVEGGTAEQTAIIEATALFSPGRSFVGRSQYRLVFESALAMATPVEIITGYSPKFGALVTGAKLSIRVKGVTLNGFASLPLRQDVIVAAA